MHIAAQGGHVNTVKLLINKGADIDIKDNTGVSALRINTDLLPHFLTLEKATCILHMYYYMYLVILNFLK